ncbi:zinc finger protein [Macleaya cordata]|uniref:Zinc finger protein n=1 Tax=Macleaya cordata TaxID=56857 RepID=A0A200R7M3_MACCD|nr:zinc finger protein [Macleaya cordata]
MLVELENSSAMTVSTASGEASVSSSGTQTAIPPSTTTKKKRNLPGMPDPNAEVIALSPKTLMATNRFVCEICSKGFQRDQNLQLHRRGHNLPWKLRQRTSKEIRKRVYVCPEPSCVHHDPSRALGDLTGIKKHFCRKHGEKKWKCDKCSKKYAVQSDWKAHLKTCGTKEYKCDCGTLFSRRDSFITHRAFCDALAEESAKAQTVTNSKSEEDNNQKHHQLVVGSSSSSSPPSSSAISVIQTSELPVNSTGILHQNSPANHLNESNGSSSSNISSSNNSMFTSIFASSSSMVGNLQPQTSAFSNLICAMARSDRSTAVASTSTPTTEPTSLSLSSKNGSSIFASTTTNGQESRQFSPQPAMSATALLQKAAQMGAAATSASLLRGFGISMTSSSTGQQQPENLQWNGGQIEDQQQQGRSGAIAAGLGLGLPCNGGGWNEFMMGPSSIFGSKPTTLDLLGLGMGGGGAGGSGGGGGFSALINSMDGGLDMATAAAAFRGVSSEGGGGQMSRE